MQENIENKNVRTKAKANKKKKKIPCALRNAVWNENIGPEVGKSACYCCGLEPILRSNYECGHVQSRAKGGSDKLENLKPVCGPCNGSMGTKNMIDFAEECGFIQCKIKRGTRETSPLCLRPLPLTFDEIFEVLYT